jgi:hypothetical protein
MPVLPKVTEGTNILLPDQQRADNWRNLKSLVSGASGKKEKIFTHLKFFARKFARTHKLLQNQGLARHLVRIRFRRPIFVAIPAAF